MESYALVDKMNTTQMWLYGVALVLIFLPLAAQLLPMLAEIEKETEDRVLKPLGLTGCLAAGILLLVMGFWGERL